MTPKRKLALFVKFSIITLLFINLITAIAFIYFGIEQLESDDNVLLRYYLGDGKADTSESLNKFTLITSGLLLLTIYIMTGYGALINSLHLLISLVINCTVLIILWSIYGQAFTPLAHFSWVLLSHVLLSFLAIVHCYQIAWDHLDGWLFVPDFKD